MNKKTLKITICLFFAVFLVLENTAVFAANSSKTQIEQKRAHAKKEIHKLKLLEKIETNKLYRNQRKLEQTEQGLYYNKQQYKNAQEELYSLQVQLENALRNYRAQQYATNKRINQIFKTKRKNYVEFLLSAKNINDFLDRIYFENIVMDIDRQKISKTQERTRRIREITKRLENQKNELKNSIETMNRQQKNIQSAISRNEKMIHKLKTDRATWEKSERELARQSKQIEDMINKTVSKTSKTTTITTTANFVRPVGGPITSPYGSRIHPIFKRQIFHSGVDIGAPYGANVKAANSGKVIFTGWYGGYGKVVIIDHGKVGGVPTTTLYAHLSSYRVEKGASVYRGQVIANIGTTGYSTGPHLHFEVRRNGATTNPLNYIPR